MGKKENKENQEPITEEQEAQEEDGATTTATKEKEKIFRSKKPTVKEELEVLREEHEQLRDKYLRLFAEFDNYKKRTLKEKIEFMKTAASDTMTALLPILDDFDRAKKNAENEQTEEVFSDGVNLVYAKLYNVLKQKGLIPMETDGEDFDADLHEAFTEIPAPSEDLKGKIVDTIEKGYFLKDKIIRHAKVVIGK